MRGERPDAPNNIFQGCGKLKSIHVPANAKSWAGMKKWHGIPLVFDGEDAGRQAQAEHGAAPKGGLARLRQRRMEAERQAAESAQRQTAAEREQQLKALLQIQEELRRKREARQAEKSAGASGIQTEKFPLAQGIELEMIKCPAGEFMMGYESWKTWASSQNRQLRKLHRVKLTKDFMLGKFPVTCSQWYAIMGNGKKAPKGLENTPAGNITVPEMQAFCDKLTAKFKAQLGGKVFRLPTDAEWEYASKGGKNLDGMLGKTLGLNGNTGSSSRDGKEVEAIFRQMGYTAEDHARASDTNKPFFMWNPLAVGKYKPNEWGFMDLTGNAWEVTADTIMDTVLSKEGGISSFIHVWNGRQIYSDFEIDPLLKGERHLVRTGFWEKGIAHGIGNKMGIGDNDRFPAVGFRVCIGEPLGDWNNAFSLNAAPGSVTELDLGNVPPVAVRLLPSRKVQHGI
jgi:formylglycine-generating enzyme required for sulfatase activity